MTHRKKNRGRNLRFQANCCFLCVNTYRQESVLLHISNIPRKQKTFAVSPSGLCAGSAPPFFSPPYQKPSSKSWQTHLTYKAFGLPRTETLPVIHWNLTQPKQDFEIRMYQDMVLRNVTSRISVNTRRFHLRRLYVILLLWPNLSQIMAYKINSLQPH
jgi:hypothetical protein